ncbi:peptidylprolyl isomerase [Trinickia dinghuensis]|uniref:Chaperone SurA n=1 Tax=Trinickia dinghuensis TaxID=2291023 RepID=A0A3D8K4K5_9BURK|nr:peptidylprolyl isomerase [Trinickia dinghuensis]RDU99816.1 molecular chaperone SurA [Trinickia dinghuensis]
MAIVNKLRWATLAASVASAVLLSAAPAMAQALKGQTAAGQTVDSVAAVVNDDVITMRELDERMGLISRRLQQQHAPVPPEAQLRSQVLNQMVLERVQLEKAKEDGIVVSDADVQKTLQRLAAANKLPLDVYRSRIEGEGVPWSVFSSDARNELTLQKLREKEVDSKVSVSDAEVANYIASQRGPGARAQQDLRIEHILVKVPAGAAQDVVDAAHKKAEAILTQATTGAKFESLAKENSQAADAKQGGDLGFKAPANLPDAFVKAAEDLRPGEVAPDVIRTDDGFEVMRLVDRRVGIGGSAADAPKLVQTHVRHILIRVGQGESEAAARQKLLDIRQQIEAGGDFAQFARTYSQDGSASQGGDLGWISPGETVPEFERAMNDLKDNEISEPVRSEYGYHLIQVLGRRDAEGSVQQQMDLARQAIGQRKAEQAYSDWLRELRDSAYVQYKVDVPVAQQ